MSTRCNIAVILKPEDFNRPLKRSEFNQMPIICSGARRPLGETEEEIYAGSITVDSKSPYKALQIYSHGDGYPEHMLEEELEVYVTTYEKALSLVLAGDTSGVYDGKSEVYSLGEGYEGNQPRMMKKPARDEEYLYIFDYKDNRWHVR